VEVHRAALGRENGVVPFYEDPADPATFRMSTRAGRLPGAIATAEQRRLSQFLDEDVDLLKLDVEGAEDEVLEELIETSVIARVDQLVAEYHHHLDPTRDLLDRFLGRLRSQGFDYHVSAVERISNRETRGPAFQDVLVHAYRPGEPQA
jgi:hypothetical protein